MGARGVRRTARTSHPRLSTHTATPSHPRNPPPSLRCAPQASLIAGAGSGVAVIALQVLAAAPVRSRGQFVVAAALTYVMGRKFAASGKLMPAGMIAAMSAAMAVGYAARLVGGGKAGGKAA